MAQSENFTPDILKICREVLDYLKNDPSGRPKKKLLAKELQAALEAESKDTDVKRKLNRNSSYFGQLGRHYDFTLTVERVQRREYGYRIECVDWKGRAYTAKAKYDSVSFLLKTGMYVFFRGQVTAKRSINKRQVTFLEVVSGLQKIKKPDALCAHP
jgi:hypothetical protein